MLTTHRVRAGVAFTKSHEVVNRVGVERDERGQVEYHLTKHDYQLKMNRISSRLPPTLCKVCEPDENDLSAYCSSNPESFCSSMMRRKDDEGRSDGLDCSEIDKELYRLAAKHQESDMQGETSWRRGKKKPMEVFMDHEALARNDIENVEGDFFQKLVMPFSRKSVDWRLSLSNEEKCGRKMIEDMWMSESLLFLGRCSKHQVDFIEEFWRRALGKVGRAPRSAEPRPSQMFLASLDGRLYWPLLQRCETIRQETEAEEEIAFRYLQLGEATQRDLIESGVLCHNGHTGLLDSVCHPVTFREYDKVDFAFHAEFRYLVSQEETGRMAIIDAALAEVDELCMSMDTEDLVEEGGAQ